MRWLTWATLSLAACFALGCEFVADEESNSTETSGNPPMTCSGNPDPLATGIKGTDDHDCLLIDLAQRYRHPDAMLVKAQVQQESVFNLFATSSDIPCNIPTGWTKAESKSFGLIQITPACNEATSISLANGHPNLTQDQMSALWETSVYNPARNLEEGFDTIVGMLTRLRQRFPGCTETQYKLMSAGAYNSGELSVSGCGIYNERAQFYVNAILVHYRLFSSRAGWPNPY